MRKSLRRCFPTDLRRKFSVFSLWDATWHRFWSPRRAPGRSWAHFLASRVPLVTPPGAPGARRGRPKTLLRRSQDASGTLLGATGHPERVPGPILTRFWVPRDLCWDRFRINVRVDFLIDFASKLASECHNVTFLRPSGALLKPFFSTSEALLKPFFSPFLKLFSRASSFAAKHGLLPYIVSCQTSC